MTTWSRRLVYALVVSTVAAVVYVGALLMGADTYPFPWTDVPPVFAFLHVDDERGGHTVRWDDNADLMPHGTLISAEGDDPDRHVAPESGWIRVGPLLGTDGEQLDESVIEVMIRDEAGDRRHLDLTMEPSKHTRLRLNDDGEVYVSEGRASWGPVWFGPERRADVTR